MYTDLGILTSSFIQQKLNTVRGKQKRPEVTTVSNIHNTGSKNLFFPGIEFIRTETSEALHRTDFI